MYRKLVITAVTATAIAGTGTAAFAATGGSGSSGSQPPAPRAASGAHHPRPAGLLGLARQAVRGQVVVKDKNGRFVTEQFARGVASAVDHDLIRVRSRDGVATAFTVTTTTKVEKCTPRAARQATTTKTPRCTSISIDAVAPKDRVVVIGTGASAPVARRIVDLGPKPTTS